MESIYQILIIILLDIFILCLIALQIILYSFQLESPHLQKMPFTIWKGFLHCIDWDLKHCGRIVVWSSKCILQIFEGVDVGLLLLSFLKHKCVWSSLFRLYSWFVKYSLGNTVIQILLCILGWLFFFLRIILKTNKIFITY